MVLMGLAGNRHRYNKYLSSQHLNQRIEENRYSSIGKHRLKEWPNNITNIEELKHIKEMHV